MSKTRNGFVTNSSSSSFIISKNDATKEEILQIMIELANETYWNWDLDCNDDYTFTEKDLNYNEENCICSISNFFLNESKEERPYHKDYCWNNLDDDKTRLYENHWIIDNQGCFRYNWSQIEKILDKYNILLKKGYCD